MAEKFRFEIDGFSPMSLPLTRLADYAKDLATLLGNFDHVHLLHVDEGSAVPTMYVPASAAPKVERRILGIRNRIGPDNAMRAYESIDRKLTEDKTCGRIRTPAGVVLEFLGIRRPKEEPAGPVSEEGILEGEMVEISGRDETITIYIRDSETQYRCSARREQARGWGQYVFSPVRARGVGKWIRDETGKWRQLDFQIRSLAPLQPSTLRASLQAIRALAPPIMPEPIAYLRDLDHEP